MLLVAIALAAAPAAALVLSAPARYAAHATGRHEPVVARTEEGVKLATDIKGKPVWDLRTALDDDMEAVGKLVQGAYPNDILMPLLSSGNCIVGESGGALVSVALVHTYKGLRDESKGVSGGLDERADLLSVLTASGLPADMRQKTALGALKKLKGKGYLDVICTVASDDKENVEFARSIGLEEAQSGEKDVTLFRGMLMSMNPDPQKKIKD